MSSRFLMACDTMSVNPWSRDRLPAVKEAAAGLDFDIIDIYEFNSKDEAHYIHEIKGSEFFSKKDICKLNQKFYHRVMSYDCEILILCTVDNYSWFLMPETVEKLQKKGVFVVGVLGDDEFTSKRNRLYVPMFDMAVAYVKKYVDYYNTINSNNCYYLPSSCYFPVPDFFKLHVAEEEKKYSTIFMGSPHIVRPRLVRGLIDAGIDVSIFGSSKWKTYLDLKSHYYGYVPFEEIGNVIQHSKIYIAPLEDHLTGALHMNTKIWDAVKYGQMCITTHYSPLLKDYGFVENDNIVMYHSDVDLVNKVKYYLKNPEKRQVIAKKMFSKVKNDFNYVDLYKKFFTTLECRYKEKFKGNKIRKTRAPQITIIDLSISGKPQTGFGYLNIPLIIGSNANLRKQYHQIIKTPYVILTYGGFVYSQYLNRMVALFPDELVDGRTCLRLVSRGFFRWPRHLIEIDTLIWEKESFFKQYLCEEDSFSPFYGKDFIYGFSNMKLCKRNEGGFFSWIKDFFVRSSTALKNRYFP
ncbi:glycosyltransferase [Thermodesulfobacteriota bacterium]